MNLRALISAATLFSQASLAWAGDSDLEKARELISSKPLEATSQPANTEIRYTKGHLAITVPLIVGAYLSHQLEPFEEDMQLVRFSASETNALDLAIREAIHLPTRESRKAADNASDVVVATLVGIPMLLHPIVHGVQEKSPLEGAKLFVSNLEAVALTTVVSELVKNLVGRERPYALGCETDGSYDSQCDSTDQYRSFPSGHETLAATGAGLICSNTETLDLYGSDLANRGACYTAIGGAASVAVLRIAADKHWASDVSGGAIIGASGGYLYTKEMHMPQKLTSEPNTGIELKGIRPDVRSDYVGVSVMGAF